jgi:hypothetical protein
MQQNFPKTLVIKERWPLPRWFVRYSAEYYRRFVMKKGVLKESPAVVYGSFR